MTRRPGRIVITAVLAAAMLLAGGCSIIPEGDNTATVEAAPTAAPEVSQNPDDTDGAPLEIARDVRPYGAGYIVYPRVFGQTAETINTAVCDAVAQRAREYAGAIFTRYRIEYNDDGIYSILISVHDFETDELLFLVPLTFDSITGERRRISDYLFDDTETWRTVLPDMITEQAELSNMTLLSDIAPITDEQDFYITNRYIVIVYRLYEVATYSAGSPEFRLPISELRQYIREGSALLRLLTEEAQ